MESVRISWINFQSPPDRDHDDQNAHPCNSSSNGAQQINVQSGRMLRCVNYIKSVQTTIKVVVYSCWQSKMGDSDSGVWSLNRSLVRTKIFQKNGTVSCCAVSLNSQNRYYKVAPSATIKSIFKTVRIINHSKRIYLSFSKYSIN